MKFFITLILANLLNHQMISQNDSIKKFKIDSLNHKLRRDSLHTFRFKKLRPYANLDNRNSFIKNKPANFSGLQLGVIINEYHTFGFGLYSLNPNAKGGSQIKNNYQIANLKYTTFFYEYFLVNKKYLEIDLPFEIGFGNYSARKPNDLNPAQFSRIAYSFIPLGAATKIILKPVRWIGLSIMGGYRYVFE